MRGDDLRGVRERASLTQAAAAAEVGRSRRQWIRWEAGDADVDEAVFELFCRRHKIKYPRVAPSTGNPESVPCADGIAGGPRTKQR